MLPIRDVNPTVIKPVLTLALIVANIVVFVALQPSANSIEAAEFNYEYAAIPCEITTGRPLDIDEVGGGPCQESPTAAPEVFPDKSIPLSVLASMFLHGGVFHLFFNMWSLWIFGNNVEEAFGKVGYLAMYFAAGIIATLGFVFLNQEGTIPLVGASGAIAGVMGSYLVLFPRERILSLVGFLFLPVPAYVFIGVWFFSQFAFAGSDTNVAWEARVIGFLFGLLLALILRGPLLARITSYRRVQWPEVPAP